MADSTSTNDLTYTPTTWADGADGGTAITAARLNNIEQGINNATTQVNANTKSIKTLGDSVSQFDMTVDANSVSSRIDAIKKIVESMDSQRVNFACGQYNWAGYHGFVAMRYKSGEAYAAVISFNAWGEATLFSENNGAWTEKNL